MAQQIDNAFDPKGDPIADFSRTNPWACPTNNAQLRGVPRYGGQYVTGWDAAITGAGDLVTFTPTAGNQTPTPEYFKWVIRDQSGNEAFGALDTANPTTPVGIDTSGLNASDDWLIEFSAKQDDDNYVAYGVIVLPVAIQGNQTVSVSYNWV